MFLFYECVELSACDRELGHCEQAGIDHLDSKSILTVDTTCAVVNNVSVELALVGESVLCRKSNVLEDQNSVVELNRAVAVSIATKLLVV